MTPTNAALLTLAFYAAIGVAAVCWQMVRCASGPLVWWLYAGERLLCGLLWHVRGVGPDGRSARCPFPAAAPALIVANHRSPADPVLVWQNHHLADRTRRIRPISYLMAREYYEGRWLNWFYRAVRSIPVNRGGQDTAAVRQALTHLKAGDLVGIFPEGGINEGPPGLRAANPGVAFLALSTDAPVYPVYIDGAPVGATMIGSVLRSARTTLVYGPPIDLASYRGRKKSQELLREVTDLIMTTIASLGGVPYAGTPLAEETPAGPRESSRPRPATSPASAAPAPSDIAPVTS